MTQRRSLQPLRQDKFTNTPQNGLAIEAIVSRVGVLEYVDFNGETRREYRPPEEVFSSASIESLKNSTVTVEHPPEQRVHTENFRQHAVGHVGEDVRIVGDALMATIYVNDEETVRAILNGDLKDISPGYRIQYDATSGSDPHHGEYDVIQRNIQYNHISLLPYGEGRQGTQVGLRLDSKGSVVLNYTQTRSDNSMDPEELKAQMQEMLDSAIESAMSKIPDMVKEMVMAEMAGAAPAPAVDEGDEPKLDDAESDEGDDPLAGIDEELKLDEMVEERLDKRLEAVRAFEKITGEVADYKNKSDEDLLRAAAQAAGLECRADASRERLLGLLEGSSAKRAPVQPKLAVRADHEEEVPKDEFVSNAERNARWIQNLASKANGSRNQAR